jgi:Helix-turn-helix domain
MRRSAERDLSGKALKLATEADTAEKRGYNVREFARIYGIGITSTYEEIKAGRLKIRKVGRRTVIATEDAEAWFSACAAGQSRERRT